VLDTKQLPSTIADSIDSVRHIGNFAAHPIKSQSTGEIVDVEPNEAEWNLDVLESLFDFYYVLPAKAQAKKRTLIGQKTHSRERPTRTKQITSQFLIGTEMRLFPSRQFVPDLRRFTQSAKMFCSAQETR
jgi:hypothetical protein